MAEHASPSPQTQPAPAAARPQTTHRETTSQEQLPDSLFQRLPVQRKLTIGSVDDPLEAQAEDMADRVMRMPETAFIQRKCAHCEAEEPLQRKPLPSFIQRKAEAPGGRASESVTARIQSSQGGGSPMGGSTRRFMESRFGADFSGVRIHTGGAAESLSRDLNAQAFTVGRSIYFNQGKYAPDSAQGRHLLAHELTHTIQQGGLRKKIDRMPDEEDIDLLNLTTASTQIQKQEAPLTRSQEIGRSNTSPGEASVSLQPLSISIYNFAINSHQLKTEHEQLLREIVSLLSHQNTQNWRVDVTGNTDSSGEPVVNDPLSLRRANEVRRFLRRQLGARIISHGEGEDVPFDSNETVSGRSRNRRVDIVFISSGSVVRREEETPTPDVVEHRRRPTDTDTNTGERPRRRRPTETEEDNRGFCARHPIICGLGGGSILLPIILCGFYWEICLCLAVPTLCTIPPPPPPPPPTDPDPERERPAAHACVIGVDLPAGDLPMHEQWPYLALRDGFWMYIDFRQNSDEGCECHCGEFQQNVRGFFEKEYADGRVERRPKRLTPGVFLDETTFHEDGDGSANSEYGHRSHRKRAIDDDRQTTYDAFFPTQADGCYYMGNDNPGFGFPPIAGPDEVRRTIFLEFEGGPVDTCLVPGVRTPMREHWSTWRVRGEIRKPTPPRAPRTTTPPAPTGTTGGTAQVVTIHPTPTTHAPGSVYPSWYAGGISPTAGENDLYDMQFAFRINGRSEVFLVVIPVRVISADANSVTVETTNDTRLNVAPAGAPEVMLEPHRRITLSRELLRRIQAIITT